MNIEKSLQAFILSASFYCVRVFAALCHVSTTYRARDKREPVPGSSRSFQGQLEFELVKLSVSDIRN